MPVQGVCWSHLYPRKCSMKVLQCDENIIHYANALEWCKRLINCKSFGTMLFSLSMQVLHLFCVAWCKGYNTMLLWLMMRLSWYDACSVESISRAHRHFKDVTQMFPEPLRAIPSLTCFAMTYSIAAKCLIMVRRFASCRHTALRRERKPFLCHVAQQDRRIHKWGAETKIWWSA